MAAAEKTRKMVDALTRIEHLMANWRDNADTKLEAETAEEVRRIAAQGRK